MLTDVQLIQTCFRSHHNYMMQQQHIFRVQTLLPRHFLVCHLLSLPPPSCTQKELGGCHLCTIALRVVVTRVNG